MSEEERANPPEKFEGMHWLLRKPECKADRLSIQG
jgi:hypothetical protein